MHIIEQQAKQDSWPILTEIKKASLNFGPEVHWLECRCVQAPTKNANTPKFLEEFWEGREFTATTSEYNFSKSDPEELEYFNSLPDKYKRRTNVIWITEQKFPKNQLKFATNKDKIPGFFPFKAIGCPTI